MPIRKPREEIKINTAWNPFPSSQRANTQYIITHFIISDAQTSPCFIWLCVSAEAPPRARSDSSYLSEWTKEVKTGMRGQMFLFFLLQHRSTARWPWARKQQWTYLEKAVGGVAAESALSPDVSLSCAALFSSARNKKVKQAAPKTTNAAQPFKYF